MNVEAKDREAEDGYKCKAGGIVGYTNVSFTFTSCTNNGVVSAIGTDGQLADSLCNYKSGTISWSDFKNNVEITTKNHMDNGSFTTVGTETGTFNGSCSK